MAGLLIMGLNYVLGSNSHHAMAKDVRVIQLQIVQQIAEEEKAWEYFVEPIGFPGQW